MGTERFGRQEDPFSGIRCRGWLHVKYAAASLSRIIHDDLDSESEMDDSYRFVAELFSGLMLIQFIKHQLNRLRIWRISRSVEISGKGLPLQ